MNYESEEYWPVEEESQWEAVVEVEAAQVDETFEGEGE